jgi:hypothetical protein
MQTHSKKGYVYMKVLNVRFSEDQRLKIDALAEVIGIDFSKVARAAMRLGMAQLLTVSSADMHEVKELIKINDALAK